MRLEESLSHSQAVPLPSFAAGESLGTVKDTGAGSITVLLTLCLVDLFNLHSLGGKNLALSEALGTIDSRLPHT